MLTDDLLSAVRIAGQVFKSSLLCPSLRRSVDFFVIKDALALLLVPRFASGDPLAVDRLQLACWNTPEGISRFNSTNTPTGIGRREQGGPW